MADDRGRAHSSVVITHDLDLDAILAAIEARGPGVIQIRAQDTHGKLFAYTFLRALKLFETELSAGALIVVDAGRMRARTLPLRRE